MNSCDQSFFTKQGISPNSEFQSSILSLDYSDREKVYNQMKGVKGTLTDVDTSRREYTYTTNIVGGVQVHTRAY